MCTRRELILDFIRIGDKLISREKAIRTIDKILSLRAAGFSQQDAADRVGVDRTFVSRLETLAEVRKGGSIAVIGFPLENCTELEEVCDKHGVDYSFLMTDKERWQFIESKSGLALLDFLMELLKELRNFDVVVMIGSDMRIQLAEALLGDTVIGVELGRSPMKHDVYYAPDALIELISNVKGGMF